MAPIALIRHGETDWNSAGRIQGVTDVPLNQTGIAQAETAAERLVVAPFARLWAGVVTSPLDRARTTGAIIADGLGIPLLDSIGDLRERDYGHCEGMTMQDARTRYPDGAYPGSEDNTLVTQRALNVINAIRDQAISEPLIVVTHGGLLHSLLSHLCGRRVPSIMNTAINLIEADDLSPDWMIRFLNGEPHSVGARD